MIFFALGGDLFAWKPEAASCDYVFAEVKLNGVPVTLRREITDAQQQPMWIYFGDFEAANASSADGWQKYPYRRVHERESFTQVLFRHLEIPEVPAEADANITIHQILRLMYVDQMTPVDRIFRFEAKDSALRRQAVGDLLCGVYDRRIYPAQLQLRDKERQYQAATEQYGALSRILAVDGEGFNLDFITGRRNNLRARIDELQNQIAGLKSRRYDESRLSKSDNSIVVKIKTDLDKVNADASVAELQLSELKFQIADADVLMRDIEKNISRLTEGEAANAALGPINFLFCPSCMSPIKSDHDGLHCSLCSAETDNSADMSRYARIRNELELQLKESRELQAQRKERLTRDQQRAGKLASIRDALSTEYLNITRNYLTEADAQIDHLNSQLGYTSRELVDLDRDALVAAQLAELSLARDKLNEEIGKLKENIGTWQKQRDRRQSDVYRIIQQKTAHILSKDMHTEAEFTADSDVYFDFAEDRVTVNGKKSFSASSLTVIRNAFHLALHWTAATNSNLRYPRFLLLDNVEDKGMTEQRSQNFQRLIVAISEQIETEHQIIFTTSMVDPTLDKSNMTVGDRYSFDNKSLKLSS